MIKFTVKKNLEKDLKIQLGRCAAVKKHLDRIEIRLGRCAAVKKQLDHIKIRLRRSR